MALEEAPAKVPLADPRGLITQNWMTWLRSVYIRVGGANARNLAVVDAESATNKANITSLTSTVSGHATTLATHSTQINDILQGRQL